MNDATDKPIYKAIKATLKRISDRAKTEALREIGAVYNIKPSKARKNISIIRKGEELIAGIKIKSLREWKLSAFKFKWNKKMSGAKVEIKKGKTETFPSTFVPVLKSGHRGVFQRKGKERFPIVQPTTPTNLVSMFKEIESNVTKKIQEEYPKELKRNSLFFLSNKSNKKTTINATL